MHRISELNRIRTPDPWKEDLQTAVEQAALVNRHRKTPLRVALLLAAVVAILGGTAIGSEIISPKEKAVQIETRDSTPLSGLQITRKDGATESVLYDTEEEYQSAFDSLQKDDSVTDISRLTESVPRTIDVIPLILDMESKEYKALLEWMNKENAVQDPAGSADQELYVFQGARYLQYDSFSPAQDRYLERIAEKYGLRLIQWSAVNSSALADAVVALNVMDDRIQIRYNSPQVYDDGSWELESSLTETGNDTIWVNFEYLRKGTVPKGFMTIKDDPETLKGSLFSSGNVTGFAFYNDSRVYLVAEFDDAWATACFTVSADSSDPALNYQPTILDRTKIEELIDLIHWDSLADLDEEALLETASAVHVKQTSKTVSDDPTYPNYGTFVISVYADISEEDLTGMVGKRIEYYSDYFSFDGVRYDSPIYSIIGSNEPFKSGGRFVYTYIDVDCGNGVHYTLATYSKSANHLGFAVGQSDPEQLIAQHLLDLIPYRADRE